MKKLMTQVKPCSVGISILLSVSIARGENTVTPNLQSLALTPREVKIDRASYPKNPHLVELEKRLRWVVLASQPDTKIDFIGDELVISYYSEKFATHLPNFNSYLPRERLELFPGNFSEFDLRLRLNKDVMYYRSDDIPAVRSMPFGSSDYDRYNLSVIADNSDSPKNFPEVPREHWAYRECQILFNVGLLHDRRPNELWHSPRRPMARFEFAMELAHLMNDEVSMEAINANADAKNAVTNLQQEFAPELADFLGSFNDAGERFDTPAIRSLLKPAVRPVIYGQTWRPRYEYLTSSFSYGKGVNTSLVKKIKQTVASYASENFSANAASARIYEFAGVVREKSIINSRGKSYVLIGLKKAPGLYPLFAIVFDKESKKAEEAYWLTKGDHHIQLSEEGVLSTDIPEQGSEIRVTFNCNKMPSIPEGGKLLSLKAQVASTP